MSTAPVTRQEHEELTAQDKRVRRNLLRLSLLNWGIAIVAWTISAYLGIASPASIIWYTILFVIGLFAVLVALLTYLLEKFGHRPPPFVPEAAEEAAGQGDVPADAAG